MEVRRVGASDGLGQDGHAQAPGGELSEDLRVAGLEGDAGLEARTGAGLVHAGAQAGARRQADERSLCGHVDASPRGVKEWGWNSHNPGGAVQGKAADSAMAAKMSFVARAGHPCGADFQAGEFLERHPEFSWQKPLLRDMKAGPWRVFAAGEKNAH